MARMPTTRNGKTRQTALAAGAATALYIRVSTDKQANEGYSLEAQREKLTAYCVAQGWPVDEAHIYVDSGVSAKTIERPNYQAMLQAVAAGDVRRIVAIKLDRLSRNTRDFLDLLDYCDDHGCGIVSIAESFDTSTPVGRAVVTVLMAFAELERKQISERMQMGRDEKARQGERNGAPVPYGYVRNEAGKWEKADDQASVVTSIFDMFVDGTSLRGIAAKLNAEHVPAPRGKAWYPAQVGYILDNGLYCGLVQYKGNDGVPTEGVPAIVDRKTYDKAGKQLAQLRRGNPTFGKAAGDLVTADVAQRLFVSFVDPYKRPSLVELARDLNTDGIPNRHGGHWGTRTVRSVLSNPAYLAAGVVDRELFEQAQARLQALRPGPAR